MKRALVLVALLAGCGSDAGEANDGPVECVEKDGLAPCCDATPLTAADCPQGTHFDVIEDPEHDRAGEQCLTDSGAGGGRYRSTTMAGAIVQVYNKAGGTNVLCTIETGRQAVVVNVADACLVACYGADGHPVAQSSCVLEGVRSGPVCQE